MTGSVAVLDFITYLVTKIICINSNIGDPTCRRIHGPIMIFFEEGRFFYSRSKFTKKVQLFGF